jgi:heme A synthase
MEKTIPWLIKPALVTGFGTAVGMWSVWYILHLPGVHASPMLSSLLLGGVLVVGCSLGASGVSGRRSGIAVGLLAGFIAALVNLLLLGSKVVTQPTSTESMAEHANQLRPDAPVIVLGFLALSAAIGAIAGFLGSMRVRERTTEPIWIGRFAIVLAFALLPLIVAGGIVTSTESGMSVPDSVTTYGSVSVLFPLSLMAEPRVFFEHTHRLFGTLVGLTALVMAFWSVGRERAWATGAVGLGIIAVLGGTLAAELAEKLPIPAAIGIIIAISVLVLAGTVMAILRGRIAVAGMGILILVVGQGLLGALRVSEISTPLALVHGVLAQLVFACAASLAAAIRFEHATPEADLPEKTTKAITQGHKFALWALWALVLQLILGAGYRHTSSHAFLGAHVLLALAVATLVILVGLALGQGDRESKTGRWAKRRGKGLTHLVITQVALGIIAVIFVTMGDANRPIPSSDELAEAPPLPRNEAIFTTAHQATGAALLALTGATFIRTRRRSQSG